MEKVCTIAKKSHLMPFILAMGLAAVIAFGQETASNPDPNNGQIEIPVNTTLHWDGGDHASDVNGQMVYFGTDFNEVKYASSVYLVGDLDCDSQVDWPDVMILSNQWLKNPGELELTADFDDDNEVNLTDLAIAANNWMKQSIYKGRRSVSSYNPGSLKHQTTYYWRIDEVNDPCTWKGNVWEFTTSYDTELNLIAHWKMDDGSNQYRFITGTVKPDILSSTITVGGTYNNQSYFVCPVVGWQIINATSPIISGTNGYLLENIEYDSVTGKYWAILSHIFDAELWYADTIDGTWTLYGTTGTGLAPCLKKFGNKWYIYYRYNYDVYVKSSSTINGTYSSARKVLSRGSSGSWDWGRTDEPYVFEYNNGYMMLYMGGDDPHFGSTEYEKTGWAWCSTPNGNFVKYENNPVLSGSSTPGYWNSGYDRAADPYAFQLDPNSNVWYVGVTACKFGKCGWKVGYFSTTDFITFTPVSTLNPLLAHDGPIDKWDGGAVLRGAAIKVGDNWYISYTGCGLYNSYCGGLATFNVSNPFYIWWDGVDTWNISSTLGTQGTAYWTRTNDSPYGAYTARGTATGTATFPIISTVTDETGAYNGTYYKGASPENVSNGAVAGKIDGAIDLDTNEGILVGSPLGIKSIAMWIKPDSLSLTGCLFQVSAANYLKLVGSTVTKSGFSVGTITIYVDGKVSSTIPDTGWHFVVFTITTAYDGSNSWIGRWSSAYFNGAVNDVRLYSKTLTAGEVENLYGRE